MTRLVRTMRLISLDSKQGPSFVNLILRTPSPSLPFLLCSSSVGFIFLQPPIELFLKFFSPCSHFTPIVKILSASTLITFFSLSFFLFPTPFTTASHKKHLPIVMTFRRDFIFFPANPTCTFMTRTERSPFTPISLSKLSALSFTLFFFRFVKNQQKQQQHSKSPCNWTCPLPQKKTRRTHK